MSARGLTKRLALVLRWADKAAALALLRPEEMELRLEVVKNVFGDPGRGTTHHDLGGGYGLKAEVNPKVEIDKAKLGPAIAAFKAAKGAVGEHVIGELFKLTPELSLSTWKKLTPDDQAFFKDVVTIGKSTPALTLTTS